MEWPSNMDVAAEWLSVADPHILANELDVEKDTIQAKCYQAEPFDRPAKEWVIKCSFEEYLKYTNKRQLAPLRRVKKKSIRLRKVASGFEAVSDCQKAVLRGDYSLVKNKCLKRCLEVLKIGKEDIDGDVTIAVASSSSVAEVSSAAAASASSVAGD